MSRVATAGELFRYNDWARDQILGRADALADDELDQSFEMGPGSVRETIRHLYGAERTWWQRLQAPSPCDFPQARALRSTSELRSAFYALAAERNAWLETLDDAGLEREFEYMATDGRPYTSSVGEVLTHVCNHGTHHRAQALNMLRRLGAPPIRPGIDYIFMRNELNERGAPQPVLDLATIRTCYAYNDWATGKLHAAAGALDDARLDQPFEMGEGSLRGTLLHLRFAEEWWFNNWTIGAGAPFPEPDGKTPVGENAGIHARIAVQRNKLLAGMTDTDLERVVVARPRPDVERRFPIGVTMLQLLHHGTHHRAQALNMLRRVGGAVPGLDYITWRRETA